MATYRKRSRARSILVVAVLAAVTLIVLDSRSGGGGAVGTLREKLNEAFSPIQQGTHSALAPIGDFLTGAADYGSLRAENQRLRNQISAMSAQAAAEQSQEQAFEQIEALQHLPFVGQIPTVTAKLINQGPSNFENTVEIDKGTGDGMAVGQAVVAPGGLVGVVSEVTGRTATVDLISDPNFVVGIDLGGGVVGSAAGSGRGSPLRVSFDEPPVQGFKLNVGQQLSTSGQALEQIPSGIPLARVAQYSFSPQVTEPTVTLQPLVNLNTLSYVSVELGSGT